MEEYNHAYQLVILSDDKLESSCLYVYNIIHFDLSKEQRDGTVVTSPKCFYCYTVKSNIILHVL